MADDYFYCPTKFGLKGSYKGLGVANIESEVRF